jgi:selenocysteine-specific translation elongation factor
MSLVVATKMDAADPQKVKRLEQWCGQNDIEVIKISSVTGEGLEDLKRNIFRKLSTQADGSL